MKTDSPELFNLIKSLSKSEKRYFRVYTSGDESGDGSNYLKIFDAIEKQDKHNDEELRVKFKGAVFVRQFPKYKNYLYDLILKSLRFYYSGKSAGIEVRELIYNADILYKKGLYSQCSRVLEKAKKIALAFEKFELLFELFRWEELLLQQEIDNPKMQKKLIGFAQEKSEIYKKIENQDAYTNLYFDIFVPVRMYGWVRDKKHTDVIHHVIGNPLMKSEKSALTCESRFLFHMIHCFYNVYAAEDAVTGFPHAQKALETLNEQPGIREDKPLFYIAALDMYASLCIWLKKHSDFTRTVDELKKIQPTNTDVLVRKMEQLYYLQISANLNIGEFDKCAPIAIEIDQWFKSYGEKINKYTWIVLTYNVAYTYFGAGDYHRALDWMNRLINDPDFNIREDIQCSSRVFSLIIHYELKNYSLLEYLIKSTTRFLTRHRRLYKVEALLMKLLRKAVVINSRSEMKNLFTEFQKVIEQLLYDPYEKKALIQFDYFSWAESKISGRAFKETFRERWNIPEEALVKRVSEWKKK